MSGKVAIVTGGNKGIGYAIVKGLVENGKFEHVYLTARVFLEAGSRASKVPRI